MASFAEWHLIQFTQDMRRREPKNIGVAATDGTEWLVRLFGVDPRSTDIDGRSLRRFGLLKDDYAQWVMYFQTMIGEGRIDQVRRSQRHRPSEFRLVSGGYTELHGPLTTFIDSLYVDLVSAEAPAPADPARVLQAKVETVLSRAHIEPQADPLVQGRWDATHEEQIRFDYGYTNGKLHLMDRLQLTRASVDRSKILARDFNARAKAVLEAGSADSFIAFYSQSIVDDIGDAVLAPLWAVGEIVNVDDEKLGARKLLDHIYG